MSKKAKHRFGAFLRLYGPKNAPTHAKLETTYVAARDSPEDFHQELIEERRLDRLNANGVQVRMKVSLIY